MPSTSRVSKRLERLVASGICSAEGVSEYAGELRRLAEEASTGQIDLQSRFFRALGDETRLRILNLLRAREMCVCEIMVALGLTQPTASHHLNLLEHAGLVKHRKEGKWVFYSITDPELLQNMKKINLL